MLDTDASAEAIGAELCQVQERQERTIAYGSLTLSAEQRKYCNTHKELLAVGSHACINVTCWVGDFLYVPTTIPQLVVKLLVPPGSIGPLMKELS